MHDVEYIELPSYDPPAASRPCQEVEASTGIPGAVAPLVHKQDAESGNKGTSEIDTAAVRVPEASKITDEPRSLRQRHEDARRTAHPPH